MIRRSVGLCFLALILAAGAATTRSLAQAPAATGSGWQLPSDADATKNPLPVDARLLAIGKGVFKEKCQKCHGAAGLGDGPDADPDSQEDMDLTNPRRAARNSDGIVFYKVSNGRRRPKMPAFNTDLTNDQIWAVVAYAQSLRKGAK